MIRFMLNAHVRVVYLSPFSRLAFVYCFDASFPQ